MIVVDTGVLYATIDRTDADCRRCSTFLDTASGPLRVPVPVIVETAMLVRSRLGADAEAAFLGASARELDRVDLTDDDWTRVAELAATYADLRLGVIDAAVVAVAERLKVTTIATLNHRDFTVVRPARCDAFELVP